MKTDTITISKDFTEAPGSRNVEEGNFSGEAFLKSILRPRFEEAIKNEITLLIDLDNTEGYATSFLEEAFGGLARIHGSDKVLKTLQFKSVDEPLLIEEITLYIKKANETL